MKRLSLLDTRVMSTLDSHSIVSTGDLTLWHQDQVFQCLVERQEEEDEVIFFFMFQGVTVYTVLLILDWYDSSAAYTI